jgi:hypothetical protein
LKRKCFADACEKIPKLFKSDSNVSLQSSSQPNEPDSQTSNYSDCSDSMFNKKQDDFNKLMMVIQEIDHSLVLSQPIDLTVKNRTLNAHAVTVGNIWKLVLETVTQDTDRNLIAATNNFLKMVIQSIEGEVKENSQEEISLALHILESIKEYYNLASKDSSRGAAATRKQVLISVTGTSVRSAKQLHVLAEQIGARPATVVNEANNRKQLEDKKKLIPYLDILGRKSPEGSRIVQDEEKMLVIDLYESEHISDVLKGHNNVERELFVDAAGVKFVLNRQKRVIKVHLADLLQIAQKQIGFKYQLRTLLKGRVNEKYLLD